MTSPSRRESRCRDLPFVDTLYPSDRILCPSVAEEPECCRSARALTKDQIVGRAPDSAGGAELSQRPGLNQQPELCQRVRALPRS